MVSTFARSNDAAVKLGYDDNLNTFLVISGNSLSQLKGIVDALMLIGMWTTSFYFGNFLGPSIAGVSVENFGFRWTSVIFSSLFFLTGKTISSIEKNLPSFRPKFHSYLIHNLTFEGQIVFQLMNSSNQLSRMDLAPSRKYVAQRKFSQS